MTAQICRRRFTADEYHQMGCAGVLSEEDHVELIDGEIVEMSPIGSRHAACVDRLNFVLASHLSGLAIVRVQNPLRLSEHSEPQPDVVLLRPRDDFYAHAHPKADDVLLLIEVAETSAEFDREVKIPRYGQAGVPEVWLVDLSRHAIELYRNPCPAGYEQVQTVTRGETLGPVSFSQLRIPVTDVLD